MAKVQDTNAVATVQDTIAVAKVQDTNAVYICGEERGFVDGVDSLEGVGRG